jgi:hypothetical protein
MGIRIQFILLLFLTITSCSSRKNSYNYSAGSKQDNLSKKEVRSILIIGKGSARSFAFLDELSEIFLKKINKTGPGGKYIFLDNKKINGNFSQEKIDTLAYDVIIEFNPLTDAQLNLNRSSRFMKGEVADRLPNEYSQHMQFMYMLQSLCC